jgi:hypothetical protein
MDKNGTPAEEVFGLESKTYFEIEKQFHDTLL